MKTVLYVIGFSLVMAQVNLPPQEKDSLVPKNTVRYPAHDEVADSTVSHLLSPSVQNDIDWERDFNTLRSRIDSLEQQQKTQTWEEVGSLFIAAVSAVAAIWAALIARSARRATDDMVKIERERRDQEIKPRFSTWIENQDGGKHLMIQNLGTVDYTSSFIRILPPDGLAGFPLTGLQKSGWGGKRQFGELGPIEAGSTRSYIAYVNQGHPARDYRISLDLTDTDGRKWSIMLTGDMKARSFS